MELSGRYWLGAGLKSAVSLIAMSVVATARHFDGDDNVICSTNSVMILSDQPTTWPWQEYASFTATPPNLQINTTGEPLSPGLIFFTPNGNSVKEGAPYIMTDGSDLVWAGPPTSDASNLRAQTLFGEPVLSYWQSTQTGPVNPLLGYGYGEVIILDASYTQIYNVCLQLNITSTSSPCDADLHESLITPYNTLLVTAYNVTTADLTSVGGPENGFVIDSLAVEIDIATGEIVFIWSPLEHVPINATHWPLQGAGSVESNPFDWFHMNSIQLVDGYYLISSRNTWTIYLVDRLGDIIWQINGEDGGDFGSLPAGGSFSWQHYARLTNPSSTGVVLHMFANDNGLPTTSNPSVGVALCLTLPPDPSQPPTLLTNLSDTADPVAAYAEGSYEILQNGDYFLGYGIQPYIKEFDSQSPTGGDVRWSAQFGNYGGAQSYRAYKSEWHAIPSTPPNLTVTAIQSDDELTNCAGGSNLRGFVSWNGATDAVGYVVYAGQDDNSLEIIGVVQRQGFETKFVLPAGTNAVQVGGVDEIDLSIEVMSEIVNVQ